MTFKLTTDYLDYAPGTYADFLASGFGIGDTIRFSVQVLDPGPLSYLVPNLLSWAVTDGRTGDLDGHANGSVTASFYINPDYIDTTLRVTATDTKTGATASTTFGDGGVALSQWANLPPPSFVNGNLNSSKASYTEGQDVPFRLALTGLTAGKTYSVDIQWEASNSGTHAYDYLTSYNYNVPGGGPTVAQLLSGTGLTTSALH